MARTGLAGALLVASCTGNGAGSSITTASAVTTSSAVPVVTSHPVDTTLPPGGLADLVLRGGSVLTMTDDHPIAEAVAVRGNEIVAVGTEADLSTLIGPTTDVVDLEGRALLPGFVDAHSHYYGTPTSAGADPSGTQEIMLAAGVTTVGEAAVDEGLLAEMQRLDDEGIMRVRSSAYLVADTACGDLTGDWQLASPPTREHGERFRIGGIKLYTDGGSCNAPAVSYEHGFGGHGDLYFTAEELAALVTPYDAAGYQVIVHAAGDRAVEATLDGLAMVIGDSGNPLRHRIDHNSVVRPETRDRYDEVGAVAVVFGSFGTCAYLGRDERFEFVTPVENQEWEWPWRDLVDLNPNTVFAWHGDFPVFADSTPVTNLSGFVTRAQTLADGTHCEPEPYHLEHALTVDEALRMMTAGAAYALDRDTEVGTVEPGKLADLVVLSADPHSIAPEELIDLSVELTVLDGEVVHCGDAFATLCGGSAPGAGVEASASIPDSPPGLAVDGDVETGWSAGAGAPQWIEITLEAETKVDAVELMVDQFPAGPTRHIIWGRRADGELVELGQIAGETDMLDVLEVELDSSVPVVAIRIETVESPSWVAWREIVVITP